MFSPTSANHNPFFFFLVDTLSCISSKVYQKSDKQLNLLSVLKFMYDLKGETIKVQKAGLTAVNIPTQFLT